MLLTWIKIKDIVKLLSCCETIANKKLHPLSKDKYKVTNWSAYNEGLKQRGSLTLWIDADIADEDFDKIMKAPKRTYKDFSTYKKTFEKMRPLFFILSKAHLVPMNFYLKYCFPVKNNK